ncbi:g4387 [Coccomyxa elongata]
MSFVLPVATQVGLQLLLQPASSSVIANAGCQVVGLAYPAYATCKALDQPVPTEKSHWLCYWLAFGGLTAVESLVTQRFPGYYHLKFLVLLWLQSRRYQGAKRLYTEFVRPIVRKAEPKFDAVLIQVSTLKERSDVKAVAEHCHHILARIPVLEWFVRSPADESTVESWLRSMLST